MAPYTGIPLSPAELSYLHTSLSAAPPIRPDGRTPTQFRPLVAESDILPSVNGSSRICFADGTEAIVGVKAEVEKTVDRTGGAESTNEGGLALGRGGTRDVDDEDMDDEEGGDNTKASSSGKGKGEWVEVAIDIPGIRDDDALPVFLATMLVEALLADEQLKDRLWINSRFHWRLYIDILLLSPPLSYPLPLLSLTTHLALLNTRIPALISEKDEDPLFNDDWEASTYLFPQNANTGRSSRPAVTLLVMSVGNNIFFDPAREELAVADAVFAISLSTTGTSSGDKTSLKIVALRTIDPPSRLTSAGVPNVLNTTMGASGAQSLSAEEVLAIKEKDQGQSVWRPPRGGVKREVLARMMKMVVESGGVGEEVLEGLAKVER